MEINKNIKWSSHLEEYFKDLGEKAFCYSYLNKKAAHSFSYYRNFIDLPVIVLSTIAGTLSIGGGGIWGEQNDRIGGIVVGVVSLGVGILNTVGSYFSFAKRSENHRLSAIQYGKLYRFLSIELSLPPEERMRPADLIKISRDTYERLAEVTPLIPNNIVNKFKEKFKDYNVSKPSEANGLEKIIIYTENNINLKNAKDTIREIEDEVNKVIMIPNTGVDNESNEYDK